VPRSRGVCTATGPRSVATVLGVDLLRWLPRAAGGACPVGILSSPADAASITRPAGYFKRPPVPVISSGPRPLRRPATPPRQQARQTVRRRSPGASLPAGGPPRPPELLTDFSDIDCTMIGPPAAITTTSTAGYFAGSGSHLWLPAVEQERLRPRTPTLGRGARLRSPPTTSPDSGSATSATPTSTPRSSHSPAASSDGDASVIIKDLPRKATA
jgi:hypothetical protein